MERIRHGMRFAGWHCIVSSPATGLHLAQAEFPGGARGRVPPKTLQMFGVVQIPLERVHGLLERNLPGSNGGAKPFHGSSNVEE